MKVTGSYHAQGGAFPNPQHKARFPVCSVRARIDEGVQPNAILVPKAGRVTRMAARRRNGDGG